MNIGLEYMRRKMSNRNQLYKDLKPKDRIVKIITAHIVPELGDYGFWFVKSRMQLERSFGDFKQIIWFRTNMKNYRDEVVEFAVHLRVDNNLFPTIRDSYQYTSTFSYHNGKQESTFIAESAEYIDEWENHLMNYWYSLHLDDNQKIVDSIIQNIKKATKTYLDANSDFEKSLEFRFNKFKELNYFGLLWIPDILILSNHLGKTEITNEVLQSYESWKKTEDGISSITEGAEIFNTIEKIKNMLQQRI